MFRSGDQVMYGAHGMCTIVGTEKKQVNKKPIEYYVLQPQDQPASRYYIPTQNQAALAKLHPIMSCEELNRLIGSAETQTECWIDDENLRKKAYKELIAGGDRAALIRMVYTIHLKRKEQTSLRKKLHMCDANFLREAEKLLKSEFSLVLNIPTTEVENYIMNIATK